MTKKKQTKSEAVNKGKIKQARLKEDLKKLNIKISKSRNPTRLLEKQKVIREELKKVRKGNRPVRKRLTLKYYVPKGDGEKLVKTEVKLFNEEEFFQFKTNPDVPRGYEPEYYDPVDGEWKDRKARVFIKKIKKYDDEWDDYYK